MADQVQGAGYSESEVETDTADLELEIDVATLKLETDAATLELETDIGCSQFGDRDGHVLGNIEAGEVFS
jgi:hypothetical protein